LHTYFQYDINGKDDPTKQWPYGMSPRERYLSDVRRSKDVMGLADRDYMKGGYDEGDHPPACTCWKCNEVRRRRRAEEGPRADDGAEDMLEGLPPILQNRMFWAAVAVLAGLFLLRAL
jgi:hypothetical protein